MFKKVYMGNGHLTLQTVLRSVSEIPGTLFLIAEPSCLNLAIYFIIFPRKTPDSPGVLQFNK